MNKGVNYVNYKYLRKKHPRFIYESYEWKVKGRDLRMSFDFFIHPDIHFSPCVTIKNVPIERVKKLGRDGILDNFVFHIGLAEMPSYWKAAASPIIEVGAGTLDSYQRRWWKKLFMKGLGEYCYANRIDFTQRDFLTIKANTPRALHARNKSHQKHKTQATNSVLIPIGGGKDSIVTLELLKNHYSVRTLMLNPTRRMKRIAEISKTGEPIIVERIIDPTLLALNKKGYLNGHTPFSSYLAFLSVFCAVLFDLPFIALSNERSANEGNTRYRGQTVNHQYSKSYEFERDFRLYSKKYLTNTIEYFSFLRPLYEIQIARLFSYMPQYFSVFLSCNRGQKMGAWCLACPKCAFAYLILSPFIAKNTLKKIFGRNLLNDRKLRPVFEELAGLRRHKPFECVGTHTEVRAIRKNKEGSLVYSWSRKHFLPKQFEILLKGAVHVKNIPTFLRMLEYFSGKRVLIVGCGQEGQDTLNFIRRYVPGAKIGIADRLPFKKLPSETQHFIKTHCRRSCAHFGSRYLEAIKKYDIIVKSPGVPLRILPKIQTNQVLTSETNIFFDLFPGIIVGITGTKGKSTTAKLIYEILKERFPSCFLVGNIGTPALSVLPDAVPESIAVYELSSFQLELLRKSPHIAVFLNVYQEHLDHHGNFGAYIRAKANIARHQRAQDIFIFNAENKITKNIAKLSRAKKIPISMSAVPLQTAGKAHPLSVAAARAVAKVFHVPEKTVQKVIHNFTPLPHRLEYVGTRRGIHFYDDSISTVPESTIYALETLGSDVGTLILGGYDRGVPFQKLADSIRTSEVKTIILFPPSGERIEMALRKSKFQIPKSKTIPNLNLQIFKAESMREAVRLAYKHTEKGKICLLSPASPSFGMFRSYEERGNLFKKFVRTMGR